MLFWYNRTIHELMPATHVDFQSIRSTKHQIMRMCDVIREEEKKVKKLKK
jgi:hypothetical protein